MEVLLILFICVAINHLGLISAIESIVGHRLIVINCPKCLSFWCILVYLLLNDYTIIESMALSLGCAWLAIWIALYMGIIDKFYTYIYDEIYSTKDKECEESDFTSNTSGSMS